MLGKIHVFHLRDNFLMNDVAERIDAGSEIVKQNMFWGILWYTFIATSSKLD